jgi:hypothetical protein
VCVFGKLDYHASHGQSSPTALLVSIRMGPVRECIYRVCALPP